jgi:hypothetical protein
MKLCRALYDARHDYLHGNPIKNGTSPDLLSHYASVLYRLALTEFLALHRRIPHIPGRRGKTWAKKLGKEIALQIDFNQHQERYEDALDTFVNPRATRGQIHRRKKPPPSTYATFGYRFVHSTVLCANHSSHLRPAPHSSLICLIFMIEASTASSQVSRNHVP